MFGRVGGRLRVCTPSRWRAILCAQAVRALRALGTLAPQRYAVLSTQQQWQQHCCMRECMRVCGWPRTPSVKHSSIPEEEHYSIPEEGHTRVHTLRRHCRNTAGATEESGRPS